METGFENVNRTEIRIGCRYGFLWLQVTWWRHFWMCK